MWTSPWSFLSSASMDLGLVSLFAAWFQLKIFSMYFRHIKVTVWSSLSWSLYGSPCWPLPASLASFCLCGQRDHQLDQHVPRGDAVRLHCGEMSAVYRLISNDPDTFNPLSLCHIAFVSVQDGLGQFCFLIFVAYCVFSAAFLIFFVPETKGKTMVEIMEDFNTLNYRNRSADAERTDIDLATKF